MGLISGIIQASAALAAQAQLVAGRQRNRQQVVEDEVPRSDRRVRDVDGVELSPEATPVPGSGSEQSRQEHQRQPADGRPRGVRKVDLTI